MEGSVASTQKPFHESIVDALDQLPRDASNDEISRLFQLILRTSIEANHDEIDESLRRLGREVGITLEPITEIELLQELKEKQKDLRVDLRRTIESVREQKFDHSTPVPLSEVILTEEEERILDPVFVQSSIERAMEAVRTHTTGNPEVF
jgi:hypothetical protein